MLKELEIMYRNADYTYISWCSKICQFPVKKWWCQQNSGAVSRDLYIFGSSLGKVELCEVSSLQDICETF